MYPGTCSIEYQSIVQIALKILFGLDQDKQQACKGNFGEQIAHSIGHEEKNKLSHRCPTESAMSAKYYQHN